MILGEVLGWSVGTHWSMFPRCCSGPHLYTSAFLCNASLSMPPVVLSDQKRWFGVTKQKRSEHNLFSTTRFPKKIAMKRKKRDFRNGHLADWGPQFPGSREAAMGCTLSVRTGAPGCLSDKGTKIIYELWRRKKHCSLTSLSPWALHLTGRC